MKSEWEEVKLSEIAEINMGQSPASSSYNNLGEGEIFYQGNKDFGTLYPSVSTYTTEPKKIANKDDVLISVRAPVGELNIANRRCCIGRGLAAIRLKENHSRFLYYMLKYSMGKLHQVSTGTTFSSINKIDLANLAVLLPPLLTQKKIAHILSTLDDKIELNRKMNQTLEAMAQALFKSWFVDFDPVRAKAEAKSEAELEAKAKELGISKEVLELFPSRFVESEMGMIPDGWEVKPISEVSSIAIGKTPPRKEHQWFTTSDNNIKWISIKDMGNSGVFVVKTNEYLTREAIEKFNIKIVPTNTVLLSFKLTLGRVSITTEEMTTNEAIAHFILENDSLLSPQYIYCYLKAFDYSSLGSTSSIATAINSKIVKSIPIVMPSRPIVNIFNNITETIFQQILGFTKEIQILEETRDTLLPKLLSGELDVSEVKI